MSTVDTFNDNNIAAEAEKEKSQDVIIELFWYIKRKRKTAFDDHLIFEGIILSLECEGIYFWRDKRYLESQKVALGWINQDHNRQQQSPTPIVSTEIHEEIGALPVNYAKFMDLVKPCARLFLSAFNEENIIPDWTRFTTDLKQFYENSKEEVSGMTAQYIPLLRDAIPNRWGVSVCSTSGQRFSIGDTTVPFSLQSVSKPVTYALAMAREGEDFMEEWIDVEPAGQVVPIFLNFTVRVSNQHFIICKLIVLFYTSLLYVSIIKISSQPTIQHARSRSSYTKTIQCFCQQRRYHGCRCIS